MGDDFKRGIQRLSNDPISEPPPGVLRNEVLQNLQGLLQIYSSSLTHFGLPMPTSWNTHISVDDLISQELQYDTSVEDNSYNSYQLSLNTCQKKGPRHNIKCPCIHNSKTIFPVRSWRHRENIYVQLFDIKSSKSRKNCNCSCLIWNCSNITSWRCNCSFTV